MPCFHPMKAVSIGKTVSGKRKLVFCGPHSTSQFVNPDDDCILLPCGQCSGCRLERSRQWAIRIMHEAQLWDDNCFITLTYDEEHLPDDLGLRVQDFQKFMKRLRKEYGHVRYFHCGEYGDRFGRPHFHAALFNLDFADKQLFTVRNGYRLFVSESLKKLWPFGFSSVGSLTFESAAYVARYVMKKVNGKAAADHYLRFDITEEGEILDSFSIRPEYVTMSRRPGIGKHWFNKYGKHTYDWDYVIMNGHELRPPKAYDSWLEFSSPDVFSRIKSSRKADAAKHVLHSTPERLSVREQLQLRRLNFLPRKGDF